MIGAARVVFVTEALLLGVNALIVNSIDSVGAFHLRPTTNSISTCALANDTAPGKIDLEGITLLQKMTSLA
jgi:hypothetical protein